MIDDFVVPNGGLDIFTECLDDISEECLSAFSMIQSTNCGNVNVVLYDVLNQSQGLLYVLRYNPLFLRALSV